MSKIKIVGHASGSGVLTIAAPNTNTDRTITIPDVTGTLLDSGSDLPAANLTGTIADARFPATLPAASAANLTAIPAANITGTLPAISATNLTNVPAANITGTLPAISGANLTSVNAINSGRKNLIINGAMQVAQRGTSTTGISATSGFYACDRVKLFNQTAGPTYTVTQDTSAPTGFVNSFKVQCTTADTSLPADHYTILRTGLIERSDMVQSSFGTSSAKSLTYSFWVKANKTGDQLVMFVDHKNQKEIGQVFTISTADTWEKKVITVVGNTGSSFDNSSSLGLSVDFYLAVGTNRSGGSTPTSWGDRGTTNAGSTTLNIADSTANYFQVTGVQLELGSVATDFEHRSFGEILADCQRYFQQTGGGSPAKANSSTEFWVGVKLLTQMRANPSVSITNPNAPLRIFEFGVANRDSNSTPSISSVYGNTTSANIRCGTFSGISGGSNAITGGSSSGAVGGESAMMFNFDAEL